MIPIWLWVLVAAALVLSARRHIKQGEKYKILTESMFLLPILTSANLGTGQTGYSRILVTIALSGKLLEYLITKRRTGKFF